MKNILYFALLCVFLISACATPSVARPIPTDPSENAPTATEVVPVTPTATEVVPTEVPISYEIPYTTEGKIDVDRIVNVVPTEKAAREEYFGKIKEYLIAKQTAEHPDGKGILGCNIFEGGNFGIGKEWNFFCGSYPSVVSPDVLSKDENGNVVMTLLARFRDDTNTFNQVRLFNIVIIPDEIEAYTKTIPARKPSLGILDLTWEKETDLVFGVIAFGFGGSRYPQMEEWMKENKKEGITDETLNAFPISDENLKIDSVVFPVT